MSDRRTRRRFLADALFAGGALTAASMLGYVATHEALAPPQAPGTPQAPDVAQPDVRPPGQMVAAPSPRLDLQAAGETVPVPPKPHRPGTSSYIVDGETGGKCR